MIQLKVFRCRSRVSTALVGSMAAASILLAAGCGSSSDGDANGASTGSPGAGSGVDAAARDMLPAKIRDSGKVSVASTMGYPPEQFYDKDNKTPIGFSVELGQALGKKLGVEFEFVNTGFSAILPGIQAGRYDIAISSMSVTEERAKQVNFVEYLDAGASILAPAANPKNIQGLDGLCGVKVGMVQGSVQADTLNAYSTSNCKPAGKPAIEVVTFADSDAPYQALAAGRVDATFRDYTAQAYAAQQSNGKLKVMGDIVPNKPYGMAVAKDNLPFAKAVAKALEGVIQDGTYLQILTKWDVQAGAVKTVKLDEATG